jgi:hypothetical protein
MHHCGRTLSQPCLTLLSHARAGRLAARHVPEGVSATLRVVQVQQAAVDDGDVY